MIKPDDSIKDSQNTEQVEFSSDQLQDLKCLKVRPQQLCHLRATLQTIAPLFGEGARMQDVRDSLQKLSLHLDAALTRWKVLIASAETLPASSAALERLEAAGVAIGESRSTLTTHLQVMATIAKSAADGLIQTKSRGSFRGSASPVALIDSALRRGWDEAHGGSFKKLVNLRSVVPDLFDLPELPVYPFSPSRSRGSKFRRIVELSYGAIVGKHEVDAEAAIKHYLTLEAREKKRSGVVS